MKKKKFLCLIVAISSLLIPVANLYAMPNPTSVFCVDHGGKLLDKGGEKGVNLCGFPDGTECSLWAYFSGKCKPGMFTDWIDKNVSKKIQLKLNASMSGYISNRKPPQNITFFNSQTLLHFTEKDKAWFYYIQFNVANTSRNNKTPFSHSAKIIMKKDGVAIKSFLIKPIKRNGYSDPINIFIPMKDKGLYTFFLLTSGGDEIEKNQEHYSFDNKIAKKLTDKEIRERSLARWKKAQEEAKKKQQEKEEIAKRKKYPIDLLPNRCGFSDLYYGVVKYDTAKEVYYLVSMNRYSRIYEQFLLSEFRDNKLIGKTIILYGSRTIGGRPPRGFSGELGGRVLQVVNNNKINNLSKIKSLCSQLEKQATERL